MHLRVLESFGVDEALKLDLDTSSHDAPCALLKLWRLSTPGAGEIRGSRQESILRERGPR